MQFSYKLATKLSILRNHHQVILHTPLQIVDARGIRICSDGCHERCRDLRDLSFMFVTMVTVVIWGSPADAISTPT
jgi:hypothetical protein